MKFLERALSGATLEYEARFTSSRENVNLVKMCELGSSTSMDHIYCSTYFWLTNYFKTI